jgi:hypothetical protein
MSTVLSRDFDQIILSEITESNYASVDQSASALEFALLEQDVDEEVDHSGRFYSRDHGVISSELPSRCMDYSVSTAMGSHEPHGAFSLSASPVLISCLRDIAKTRRID